MINDIPSLYKLLYDKLKEDCDDECITYEKIKYRMNCFRIIKKLRVKILKEMINLKLIEPVEIENHKGVNNLSKFRINKSS